MRLNRKYQKIRASKVSVNPYAYLTIKLEITLFALADDYFEKENNGESCVSRLTRYTSIDAVNYYSGLYKFTPNGKIHCRF